MDEKAVAIVLGRVIAEHTQIKKVGRPRQKFERRKIAFIERTDVGPNPTDAVLFQQPDDLGPMPAGVTEFNGKLETFRKLDKKLLQNLSAILGRTRRRQLNKDNLETRFERLNAAEQSHT